MPSLGVPELVIIFVIALIFFGPRKLPELGRSLGKGLSEFKRASNELRNTLDEEIREEERRTPPPAPSIAPPVVESASGLPVGDSGPTAAAVARDGGRPEDHSATGA